MNRDGLLAAALATQERAYAPYSQFQVGAAVETETGEIFTGCNVENASYGLTICAERVAVCLAVAAGHRHFVAIAVATAGGASPCGACRQFLAEFADRLPVLIVNAETGNIVAETDLADLLPGRFQLLDGDA
ncbi:MAG: cytidine deaminase [Planctomycetaceae bacterium]|nr:cytidine deaminase [Planctomycetaceae bacterium]